MFADIVFMSSLLICMSLGRYYKKIEDPEMKRNYGAGLGILVACLICGHYIFHTMLMVWTNIIIIKCCDKRYVHQMSLAFTWLYLLYLHMHFPTSHYAIWVHQTLALRLVGLAFEVHNVNKKPEPRATSTIKMNIGDTDSLHSDLTAVDILAYSYFFIGLHKGPYYRFKVFDEHFKIPFGVLGDCRIITEQKLKKAFICSIIYLLLRMKYSRDIYYENSFYTHYDADFRYLYNIPQLALFYLQHQIILLICTSICTEAGFGVYPSKCHPLPGYGPTTRQSLVKLSAMSSNVALEQEYNFSMLKCFDNEKLLIGPKMKDTVRCWDMPTRHWFWANMYNQSPKVNKELRSAYSFLAWSIWCGPSVQQVIISTTLWVYVHLEREFVELFNTEGSMKLPWDIGFSIMRLFCLIYLTPCLIIEDYSVILRYYTSIFWMYHIVMIGLILVAVIAYKSSRRRITT